MAKKVTKTKTEKKAKQIFNRKELLSGPQSYRSLFFGATTVVILFLIGFGIARLFIATPKPEITNEAVSTEDLKSALGEDATYTVEKGDTLWSIAEEKYGSGFEWYRIADANKITDRYNLSEGTILNIPGVKKKSEESLTEGSLTLELEDASRTKTSEELTGGKITGSSYTIKEGDNLWQIAVRAYGDGYRWVEIASANNLENPDLIHVNNTLIIPR